MTNEFFESSFQQILAKVDAIDPINYARSRNYLRGQVTRLSPYITHGILLLPDVVGRVLSRYAPQDCARLLAEFAWREYFQYVWQEHKDTIFNDLNYPQRSAHFEQLASPLIAGQSGIQVIDQAHKTLIETGYMHNHARMWSAFLHCHVAKTHWLQPARWLYYHLLDGDLASNFLSWQWVAGTSRQRRYIANQENLNKYAQTTQTNTCIDLPYEQLEDLTMPDMFSQRSPLNLSCTLPQAECDFRLFTHTKTLCYSIWNLDAHWHRAEQANRVLIIEPSHFSRFPISPKRWQFILHWAKTIPHIQIYVGEFNSFSQQLHSAQPNKTQHLIFRHHLSHPHWQGEGEERPMVWPKPDAPMKGFFPFWKYAQGQQQW